jgi:hypothetical protein
VALYGLTIEKETLWEGQQERFNNTYYYEGPAEPPAVDGLRAFVNAVWGAETYVHGLDCSFKQARIWTAGGTKEQNVTILLMDLSGTGRSLGSKIFKETAVQVSWETSRLTRVGRKIYLRKFIRPCNVIGSAPLTVMIGEEPFSGGMPAPFKSYADTVQTVEAPAGVNWQLRSEKGALPRSNNNGVVEKYVSSREFRQN